METHEVVPATNETVGARAAVAQSGRPAIMWPVRFQEPRTGTVTDDHVAFPDVAYSTPLGYRPVLMDVLVPHVSRPAPVVLWVHGGGFHEGNRRTFPDTYAHLDLPGRLLRAGVAVALVDYRLSHEKAFPAQLHDLKAAVRYLRRFADHFGIDPSPIGAWGESAGGHLVSLLGTTSTSADPEVEGREGVTTTDDGATMSSSVAVVADWYGLTDLTSMPLADDLIDFLVAQGLDPATLTDEERMHPLTALLGAPVEDVCDHARWASPVAHASAGSPPFLIVHGVEDHVVPIAQGEALHAALEAAGAASTFVRVPGADHVFGGHDDIAALLDTTVDFLADHLDASA